MTFSPNTERRQTTAPRQRTERPSHAPALIKGRRRLSQTVTGCPLVPSQFHAALCLFLTANGQHSIGERYVDILLINARQLRRHFDRILALSNVDLGRQHVRVEPRERGTA